MQLTLCCQLKQFLRVMLTPLQNCRESPNKTFLHAQECSKLICNSQAQECAALHPLKIPVFSGLFELCNDHGP
jgi:hypothetical protein